MAVLGVCVMDRCALKARLRVHRPSLERASAKPEHGVFENTCGFCKRTFSSFKRLMNPVCAPCMGERKRVKCQDCGRMYWLTEYVPVGAPYLCFDCDLSDE